MEPPLRLHDVTYDADGRLTYPDTRAEAPESVLAQHIADARALFAERAAAPHTVDTPTRSAPSSPVSADFEALRWFDLPAVCLEPVASS